MLDKIISFGLGMATQYLIDHPQVIEKLSTKTKAFVKDLGNLVEEKVEAYHNQNEADIPQENLMDEGGQDFDPAIKGTFGRVS